MSHLKKGSICGSGLEIQRQLADYLASEGEPMSEKYNGWKNYETWNVALWLGNDEGLYHIARTSVDYRHLVSELANQYGITWTPDNVCYSEWDNLDVAALDEMREEL